MYRILRKENISDVTKMVIVEAPHIARSAKPGQFVIVISHEKGERVPLTIADFDREAGTITIIFQEIGKSTIEMGRLEVGDSFMTIAGPLGHATEIKNYGKVICVGGGVGIAPVFPIARALKEAGNEVISVIGARNKELLLWEDRMAEVSDQLIVTTDDGSAGRKCLVTEPIRELLEADPGGFARVWAIGPAIMMKFVSYTTKPFEVPTTVSLNTIMVDGTGMCGGCRVLMADGRAKFVCVDGPEFEGHDVDWDSLLSRMTYYHNEEQTAVQHLHGKDHKCRLDKAVEEGVR
ncbi:sulfide/dihydroorotate dehydrogenase-like FAD/NAD-binding protein [Pseudodesulfovibrio cashew]|uniref:Sulfide/dihydroorotate dehydrogenase-like FAD/NAD-binding protein n=1 Tax=Pseudodesulfovibrio cashew TaxID=2678688 RepID=A0A6I6JFZ3_9BACT|nr:sulfide/dihydroorotate dehydrogenase-like FAD/NAD-binding protein [Pseudodesulfovibrio cashew]